MIYITNKIGIFLLFNDKNDELIKEFNIFLNKFKINLENIKAKIYIYKIFKTFFYIIFLRL